MMMNTFVLFEVNTPQSKEKMVDALEAGLYEFAEGLILLTSRSMAPSLMNSGWTDYLAPGQLVHAGIKTNYWFNVSDVSSLNNVSWWKQAGEAALALAQTCALINLGAPVVVPVGNETMAGLVASSPTPIDLDGYRTGVALFERIISEVAQTTQGMPRAAGTGLPMVFLHPGYGSDDQMRNVGYERVVSAWRPDRTIVSSGALARPRIDPSTVEPWRVRHLRQSKGPDQRQRVAYLIHGYKDGHNGMRFYSDDMIEFWVELMTPVAPVVLNPGINFLMERGEAWRDRFADRSVWKGPRKWHD